jgi:hypothetical protein
MIAPLLALVLSDPGSSSGGAPPTPVRDEPPRAEFRITRIPEDDAPDGEARYDLRTSFGRYTGRDHGRELDTFVHGSRVVVVTGGHTRSRFWTADVFEVRGGQPVHVGKVDDVPQEVDPAALLDDEGMKQLTKRWGVPIGPG